MLKSPKRILNNTDVTSQGIINTLPGLTPNNTHTYKPMDFDSCARLCRIIKLYNPPIDVLSNQHSPLQTLRMLSGSHPCQRWEPSFWHVVLTKAHVRLKYLTYGIASCTQAHKQTRREDKLQDSTHPRLLTKWTKKEEILVSSALWMNPPPPLLPSALAWWRTQCRQLAW